MSFFFEHPILWPGAGRRRVQICGRLESRLESRTAAQVFLSPLPSQFCFGFGYSWIGLHFKEENLDSGTKFDSFLLRIPPGVLDLVHQIAPKNNIPGKKLFLFAFPADELSFVRCLCWFSIVKPLWFLSVVSTRTHFYPLDNCFSTRSKNFLNGLGINPIGGKNFMSNHSKKCSKGSIGCAQWAWNCGLWTIKLHFIRNE